MFNLDSSNIKNRAIEERRLGRFYYTPEFLANNPAEVSRNLFMKLIPVKVEFDYCYQRFEITAFSDEFEPVQEGQKIPVYNVEIRGVKRKKSIAYYVAFIEEEANPLAGLFS